MSLITDATYDDHSEVISQQRLTAVDWCAIVIAAALVAFAIPAGINGESTRITTLLAVGPLGLWMLARDVRRRDRAAACVVAALVWVTITALLSGAPLPSILGLPWRHSSVVIWMGSGAVWAIGRRVTAIGREMIGWTIAVGVLLNLVVAVVELAGINDGLYYPLVRGRPSGLLLHPVFFGAISAAGSAWFAGKFVLEPNRRALTLAGFTAAIVGATLSGTRVALLAAIVLAGWAIVRGTEPHRWLLGVGAIGGAILGTATVRAFGSSQSAIDRGVSSGAADRLEVWQYGLRAWVDRPIQGWGTGRFAIAGQNHYKDSWVQRFPTGGWADAHNLVVEVLVTQGVFGLVLFVTLAIVLVRRSRGPLAWMAATLVITWMLEPTSAMTLGLCALLVGASDHVPVVADTSSEANPRRRTLALCLLLVGACLAAWYSIGDLTVSREEVGEPGLGLLWWWQDHDPYVAAGISDRYADTPEQNTHNGQLSLAWAKRSASIEPDFVRWPSLVALRYLQAGDLEAAKMWAEKALEIQPKHPNSLVILESVGLRLDDRSLVAQARAGMCQIGYSDSCGPIESEGVAD